MNRFRATVIVEAETFEQAAAIMAARLEPELDVVMPSLAMPGRYVPYQITFWGLEVDPAPEG